MYLGARRRFEDLDFITGHIFGIHRVLGKELLPAHKCVTGLIWCGNTLTRRSKTTGMNKQSIGCMGACCSKDTQYSYVSSTRRSSKGLHAGQGLLHARLRFPQQGDGLVRYLVYW